MVLSVVTDGHGGSSAGRHGRLKLHGLSCGFPAGLAGTAGLTEGDKTSGGSLPSKPEPVPLSGGAASVSCEGQMGVAWCPRCFRPSVSKAHYVPWEIDVDVLARNCLEAWQSQHLVVKDAMKTYGRAFRALYCSGSLVGGTIVLPLHIKV